ncbi:MAG: DUF3857 and transglutaminase domain-containing protein [Mucilaginibacter sp.]|nr:DUF3857 and transglutaminase domain-containing protein [Mucilaginibacter sp.]
MNKFLLNLLVIICVATLAQAQDFPFGKFAIEELQQKSYKNDTSAHAYVINEFGSTRIDMGNNEHINMFFKYHTKVKIFDSKAFDKGTVSISFRSYEDIIEDVTDIKATTTYIDDNGAVQVAELDPKKIYTTTINKYWKEVKFALPNLRNGCIIEYSYTKIIPGFYSFPSWEFQDDIPKQYSEYEVHIPAFWTYNASIRGSLKLTKNKAEVERECFTSHGAKCDCSFMVYGIKDVPAMIAEDYMTASKNFLSAIYFNLQEYVNPFTGVKQRVTKEWADIDFNLKHSEYFGSQIKKNLMKPYLLPVIANANDDLSKAIAVYQYIQKTIKWNNIRSTGSENIRKALDTHSGDCGDINLALVAALKSAGIKTDAVLLSTRDNGIVNRLYPIERDFDYVVAKATIGTDEYLLDATDPLLAFGMLPMRCLNDQGRVISFDKPSYWIDLGDKQRKTTTSAFDLTLQSNGKLTGSLVTYSSGYDAYLKRLAIKKFNSTDEYVENLDERLNHVKIIKSEFGNLDSLDQPLSEKYEIEIDLYNGLNHDRMAFNPIIFDRLVDNPFKLQDRTYPVDRGMPSTARYNITMHLPAGYGIESAPQQANIGLPNKGGRFITDFIGEGNNFSYSNVIQFDKAIYAPEEYPYLKELYNKIIASEKAEIVFKKKS